MAASCTISFSFLCRFGPFSEKVFRRFTRQILSAVSYIHLNGIVHRDIKGANIMLTSGGVVKLIDFGCAKRMVRFLWLHFKQNGFKGL